jgi:hypothetical protein
VTEDKSNPELEDAIRQLGSTMKRLRGLSDEEREAKRGEVLQGPVAEPAAFLARDPVTQKRNTRYGVTAISLQKIKFRLMTLGDLRRVPTENRTQSVVEWPAAAKLRIAANCLVEPDLGWPDDWRDMPDEDFEEWAERNLVWSALDDVVMEVFDKSQPQFSMPEFRSADEHEKRGSISRPTPKTGSSPSTSTDSATVSSTTVATG